MAKCLQCLTSRDCVAKGLQCWTSRNQLLLSVCSV